MSDHQKDLELIVSAAKEAGEIALKYFKSDNEVWMKDGNSPVSEADHAVNDHLGSELRKARPDYGWMSEETVDDIARLELPKLFIVDPIDGTRGFINGSPQWCISVAVAEHGQPVAGALVCPALDQVWSASTGNGATLNGKSFCCPQNVEISKVTGSRKLNEIMSESEHNLEVVDFIPSLALRLAMVANGDLHAAFSRPGAKEWDIAAADMILRESGGTMVDLDGNTQTYNKKDRGSRSMIACATSSKKHVIALAKSSGFLH